MRLARISIPLDQNNEPSEDYIKDLQEKVEKILYQPVCRNVIKGILEIQMEGLDL